MREHVAFPDPLNLVICGVGGQGNVLASRLLGRAFVRKGYYVSIGETYGASQRGGSVMSHVRVSRRHPCGPLVPTGQAYLLVGLEPLETVRALADYGNAQVYAIVNTRPILPVVTALEQGDYPNIEHLKEAITDLSQHAWFLDATEMALGLGTPLVANIIMVGAAVGTGLLPLSIEEVIEVLQEQFPGKSLALNLQAFQLGVETMERALAGDPRRAS
ncbi:MAG: indolepyruvate oxidoreductase subunit beta [Dehalococcoidia bacterium]